MGHETFSIFCDGPWNFVEEFRMGHQNFGGNIIFLSGPAYSSYFMTGRLDFRFLYFYIETLWNSTLQVCMGGFKIAWKHSPCGPLFPLFPGPRFPTQFSLSQTSTRVSITACIWKHGKCFQF